MTRYIADTTFEVHTVDGVDVLKVTDKDLCLEVFGVGIIKGINKWNGYPYIVLAGGLNVALPIQYWDWAIYNLNIFYQYHDQLFPDILRFCYRNGSYNVDFMSVVSE